MAFQRLEYTKSWRNPADFPTYEPEEAQVRADLQLLHDEARDGINRVVDSLNAPGAAAQLPFAPREGLEADNVQDAVLEVYAAVRDAASGQIVNGSVTKEKLSQEVLERAYGGRAWVAMDVPGEGHHPDSGFPVGQQWLRPAWTVKNLDTKNWSAAAGTAEATEFGVTLTGDGSMAAASAAQVIANAGQPGDQVWVRLQVTERDSQLESLKLYLNGEECSAEYDMYETVVGEDGSVELVVTARWPAAVLAVGQVKLEKLTVINASAAERAVPFAKPVENWPLWIAMRAPFASYEEARLGFVQTAPGHWVQNQQAVLPVSMGGTGLDRLPEGALPVGGGDTVALLAPPAENAALRFRDGKPCWISDAQAAAELRIPGLVQGSYTGTREARTIALPVRPVLVVVAGSGAGETPAVLLPGCGCAVTYTTDSPNEEKLYPQYQAGVTLAGSELQLWHNASASAQACGAWAKYLNRPGVNYHWLAIGGEGA